MMTATPIVKRYRWSATASVWENIKQRPRAQSKANVLKPRKGDMLLFTTNFRAVKGSRGYYRVNMKHGVSPLHSGSRYTLGIIFHDALN